MNKKPRKVDRLRFDKRAPDSAFGFRLDWFEEHCGHFPVVHGDIYTGRPEELRRIAEWCERAARYIERQTRRIP